MHAFEAVIDRLAPYGQPSSTMVLSTPLAWRPVTPPRHPLTARPVHPATPPPRRRS